MSDYAHLDFTTWSSKAELVGDVAEVLSPQLLQQYPGTSLKRPGYVFRDGLDNSYRSFIISDDDRKWWQTWAATHPPRVEDVLDPPTWEWPSNIGLIPSH